MTKERASAPTTRRRQRALSIGRWRLGYASVSAVVLTVIVAAMALASIVKLRNDAEWVAHTEEVLGSLSQVLVSTLDAETAQRGFVLTGDTAYLQPYRAAARASLLELEHLRRLVADNPLQTRRQAMLDALTQRRMGLVDQGIDLHITRGTDAARAAATGAEGQQLQDQIRELVAQMRAEEQRLLVEREALSRASARFALASIALGALLSIAIAVLATSQLEARNAELAKASAAKSEFLASMSHEIRTPMNGIVGLTQLLARQSMTTEQLDMVRRIEAAGRSLTTIINDILDLSKIEAGQLRLDKRSFALGSVIMQLDSLLAPTARQKGIALRFELPATAPVPNLEGDPQRLEQVLLNLVGNAIKFTEQGEVVVRTRVVAQDAAGLKLRFEVSDTGVGIAPQTLGDLFQPFAQGHRGAQRHYGGTGLGLSISKQLVELMAGQIGVHSTLGLGSTFWFELPLARAVGSSTQQPVYTQPPVAPAQPRLTGLHVLTVDDNETNLDLVERALRLEGAHATLARDGQQAVQALRALPQGFDAVLMDLQMPVMDGLTATRTIRQELGMAQVPVIIFSASVLPQERDEALAAGATDFLPKPVDIEQLVATLKRHGARPSALQPAPPADQPAALPLPDASTPWPAIDGIDDSLVRPAVHGDFALFMRLCAQFIPQAANAPDAVSTALAVHDAKAAARTLHSLRGAALSLGIQRLAEVTARLEHAVQAREPLEAHWQAYDGEYSRLRKSLAPWLGPPERPDER